MGGGVLALGPLAASIAADSASAATPAGSNGTFDFDTPYNRIGTGSYKWDGALRDEGMSHIVAGMGISDMDFRCAPVITAALAQRIRYENWGYVYMGSPGPQAFVQSIIDWKKGGTA